MGRRVFITAAEVSGDKHAAHLIESLRRLDPSIQIEGHGGPAMAAAGATLHRETVSKAAMAMNGVFRAAEIYGVLRWTRKYFAQNRPDLQICVDSPAMNFHFAKAAHAAGIPVLFYVAPQLWAWREGRMKKLRRTVDRVACILPFEEAYFRGHGVNATFVGHPLFDELPSQRPIASHAAHSSDAPVIGLLPGSRKSEADDNFPSLLGVANRILQAFPKATFLVPTTQATHPVVRVQADAWRDAASGRNITYEEGAFDRLVPQCDLCVTVSGTATLHVAGFSVPMIVVYRASRLLWYGLGRWVIKTRTYALVNLLAGGTPPDGRNDVAAHIVPEFIPWYGSADPVANLAIDMLRHPQRLEEQRDRLRKLVRSLDHPGASEKVAQLAIGMMPARESTAPTPCVQPALSHEL